MPQIAGAVPGMELSDAFRTEVRSAIPTLLFSGDLDLRTPIEEQKAATGGLVRVTRVTVHGGGHDLFEAQPVIPGMIAAFFAGSPIKEGSITVPPLRR